MKSFLGRFGQHVTGVLSGFDRVRFRGTKRLLANPGGMLHFLFQVKVLLKDFRDYVETTTNELRRAVVAQAQALDQPVHYLESSDISKEATALAIAEQTGVQQGLVGVLSALEPCRSYSVHKNAQRKELELRIGTKRCLHYYHYYIDAELGWMHTRLQTWFPFTLQVCINGREWLARQMDRAGIDYVRRDNCFVHLGDVDAAQALADQQLHTDWPKLLNRLAAASNPVEGRMLAAPVPYYWSIDESEWASDVMFRSQAALAQLYPGFCRFGIESLQCRDVLRFLGKRLRCDGQPRENFVGEVCSERKQRPEGVCLRHRVERNGIKMYDKQQSVLRVETTINDASEFKVYRPKEGGAKQEKAWRKLRKGVADTHRRAQVSQKANERYLDSLAAVADKTPLGKLTHAFCQPTELNGRRVRALHPFAAGDQQLLTAIYRGEFALNGFRNRDLRSLLFATTDVSPEEQRRQSAMISQKLRLLRAHKLIHRVPKSHRYRLTKLGSQAIAALLLAQQADAAKLANAA